MNLDIQNVQQYFYLNIQFIRIVAHGEFSQTRFIIYSYDKIILFKCINALE